MLDKAEQRLDYVDYLRCFGIVLMIMGHVGFGEIFDKWIHSFHMPLWFFISGFFCNPNDEYLKHIKKRTKKILLPYIVFGSLYIILAGMLWGKWEWVELLFPNSNYIILNGALWFLPALFFSDVIVFTLLKLQKCSIATLIIVFFSVIGSHALIKLPFAIDSALVGIGFFYIGYLVRNKAMRLIKLKVSWSIIVFVILSYLANVNGYVNMRTNTYACIGMFWVTSVGLILSLFNIFREVCQKINVNWVKYIGKNSLVYVCMNQMIIFLLDRLIFVKFANFEMLVWIIVQILKVLIVILVCCFIDFIVSQTPLRIILGK